MPTRTRKLQHGIPNPRIVAQMAGRDLRRALIFGIGAFAAVSVGSAFGNLHGSLQSKVTTLAAAAAFLTCSLLAVRWVARALDAVVSVTGGRSAGVALRLVTSVAGYILAFFILLAILSVPVEHLLLGGALTGVILGVAAQQSLGNAFAGMVLLGSRVLRVGERVRMRSGPLGGEVQGVITSMGLAYVTVETSEGPLNIPNSAVLSSAIGPHRAN